MTRDEFAHLVAIGFGVRLNKDQAAGLLAAFDAQVAEVKRESAGWLRCTEMRLAAESALSAMTAERDAAWNSLHGAREASALAEARGKAWELAGRRCLAHHEDAGCSCVGCFGLAQLAYALLPAAPSTKEGEPTPPTKGAP
jgi:hypothetical protein